ncbi:2-C-methyl-D-erythritol 4-phosphate cytidylyltransferase [Anaerohalosphaera lusitana]|uniref:2-C-methyl-D-erythritol 4-phosphate cytidylyltransferase n=1 Tax=Anaerohalosphaera lusitana TaxID=1936003 RepID=A0A1U9NIU4_9BACT|nr:2-C-methyl-D-erythritol 4-phosphate cytidylyltransferase [Anaerohalosphaera lusitana]AQT67644.1 2-C-methyl-D-erythritol 4-phosphate cytidylyltransferase [Anaerohalosphaera lusitana]
MKNVAVIICAAGAGKRFGGKTKKPFVKIGGRAVFLRSVDFFVNHEAVKQIILAISPEDEESIKINFGATLGFCGVQVVHGGAERFETVENALKEVREDIDLVAVHDSVRCCLKDEWVSGVFKKAGETGAAMLACPVVATIKRVEGDKIVETVDRRGLYEAQTPQVFEAGLLRRAYEKLHEMDKAAISDDAQLVEALGEAVHVVETDSTNVKITKQADMEIAESVIKARDKAKVKKTGSPFFEAEW